MGLSLSFSSGTSTGCSGLGSFILHSSCSFRGRRSSSSGGGEIIGLIAYNIVFQVEK